MSASQSTRALEVGIEASLAAVVDHRPLEILRPWNRLEPVMIRLETPAQVMLEVDIGSLAWYPQPPSLRWAFSQ